MNSMPLVSVVIPTYNYANYLPRAIDSVLAQTFHKYEIIVVDDGSIDNTASVMDAYVTKYPDRIHYIYQKNSGPNAARNKGIESANGELIALLDADDEWLPEKLSKQVSFALNNHQIGMIGCGIQWVKDDGTVIFEGQGVTVPSRSELIIHLKMKNFRFGGSSGVVVRKRCFDIVGKFDEELRGSEDRDMWLRIAYQFEIENLRDILVIIHFHETNCHTNYVNMLNSRLKFIEKHCATEYFIFRFKAISYAFLDAAREALKSFSKMRAFIYSLKAICIYPIKCTSDDDKYQILIKSIVPEWILSAMRSKRSL